MSPGGLAHPLVIGDALGTQNALPSVVCRINLKQTSRSAITAGRFACRTRRDRTSGDRRWRDRVGAAVARLADHRYPRSSAGDRRTSGQRSHQDATDPALL